MYLVVFRSWDHRCGQFPWCIRSHTECLSRLSQIQRLNSNAHTPSQLSLLSGWGLWQEGYFRIQPECWLQLTLPSQQTGTTPDWTQTQTQTRLLTLGILDVQSCQTSETSWAGQQFHGIMWKKAKGLSSCPPPPWQTHLFEGLLWFWLCFLFSRKVNGR